MLGKNLDTSKPEEKNTDNKGVSDAESTLEDILSRLIKVAKAENLDKEANSIILENALQISKLGIGDKDSFLKLFTRLSELGNCKASTILGDHYFIERKFDEAKKYFEKAVEQGDKKDAKVGFAGCLYMSGHKNEATEIWEKLARENNVSALNNLGTHFLQECSFEKAKEYYQQLDKLGCRPSVEYGVVLYNLGDKEKALEIWQERAKEDNESALNNLGFHFSKECSFEKAKGYYQRLDKLGCKPSVEYGVVLYNLGDKEKALEIWQERAKEDDASALLWLGGYFVRDEIDIKKAKMYNEKSRNCTNGNVEKWKDSAKQGDIAALKKLIAHYDEINNQKARDYACKAIEQTTEMVERGEGLQFITAEDCNLHIEGYLNFALRASIYKMRTQNEAKESESKEHGVNPQSKISKATAVTAEIGTSKEEISHKK